MCDVHSPFWAQSTHTAALVHHCEECRRPIMRGERYVSTRGVWDGEFAEYKAHELCDMLAEKVSRDADGCLMLGELYCGVEWCRAPQHLRRWGESLLGVALGCEEEDA